METYTNLKLNIIHMCEAVIRICNLHSQSNSHIEEDSHLYPKVIVHIPVYVNGGSFCVS